MRRVLDRLDLECPTHVWISPPSDAYSPLQNLNQRSAQQQEELQQKRSEALKILVGASVVYHACVQRGIHVTLELPERCQAWRMPLFHNLKQKYSLFEAVTCGCRVGLRNSPKEPLLKRGWKLLTTHRRLSEIMSLPCVCPRTYAHGRCEGSRVLRSELYTKEFVRKVAKAVLQEHNTRATLQECQGHSQLLARFGEGSCCMCKEVTLPQRPRKCAHCLQSRDRSSPQEGNGVSVEGVASESDCVAPLDDTFEDALFLQNEVEELERVAKGLLEDKDFRHESCDQLLEMLPYKART